MVAVAGCSEPTTFEWVPSPCLSGSAFVPSVPDFSARITKLEVESGYGPNGHYSQTNLWLTIGPATAPNAGLVVANRAPVFIRRLWGQITLSTACNIRPGDSIQVWHDSSVVYGSVQGPPGAPVYSATQVLIVSR